MTRIKVMNVRCLSCGFFFMLFFLAIIESGASQQLNIIRGVEVESDASINESLCHVDVQWLFNKSL